MGHMGEDGPAHAAGSPGGTVLSNPSTSGAARGSSSLPTPGRGMGNAGAAPWPTGGS